MRDFSQTKRVVIKVGTNVLAPQGVPGDSRIASLGTQVALLARQGYQPLLVSSGAIGFGIQELQWKTPPAKVELRQACAAIGQTLLMDHWRQALSQGGLTAAQILVSRETFNHRQSYLNLRAAVEALLSLGTVPVFNENDSVSVMEIGDVFGDNDNLSAHIASKLDAGLLILLTDIDAFYDKDPRYHQDAKALETVEKINPAIKAAAGGAGTSRGSGGMRTKLEAAEVAARAGCSTVLADGREPRILNRILEGETVGTFFPGGRRLSARTRWILGVRPKGRVSIDPGALQALNNQKSLLPRGVTQVEGLFEPGDVIRLGDRHLAVASLGSEEIRRVMGRHTRELPELLGPGHEKVVARVEDIVPVDGD